MSDFHTVVSQIEDDAGVLMHRHGALYVDRRFADRNLVGLLTRARPYDRWYRENVVPLIEAALYAGAVCDREPHNNDAMLHYNATSAALNSAINMAEQALEAAGIRPAPDGAVALFH